MGWGKRRAALCAAFALGAAPVHASVYEVGPGQALAAIGEVPWATLAAGDLVRIHWRPAPYREKWVIDRVGAPGAPIVVQGVLGPGGERPVVSGDGAATPAPLDFWGEERGVIKVGGSNVPDDALPAWILIENLEVRSGHPDYGFTDDHGLPQAYAENAAAIYVEKAQHLTIRNCVLTDSGNGLFIGAFDGDTQAISVVGNDIHGNGIVGGIYEHNNYSAARGIVFEGNHFGPLRAGADGNNLKDRSAGLTVRYNWIDGGNRELDLVDAEDSPVLVGDPGYGQDFVYGNVLIEPDGAGNSQIAHYGGDSGNQAIYRKGPLQFFNNTVVSTRSGNTTLLRLSSSDVAADVFNNILYVAGSGGLLAMLDADGMLTLRHNWLKPGWVASHGVLTGAIDDDGTDVEGSAPGFVDESDQDFHLLAGSAAIDAAEDPPVSAFPILEYWKHQRTTPRPGVGPLDIGAYEYCPQPCPEPAAGVSSACLAALASLWRRRRSP